MRKSRTYNRVVFKPEVIKNALRKLEAYLTEEGKKSPEVYRTITDQDWMSYDSDEEFFADYRRGFSRAHYSREYEEYGLDIVVEGEDTTIEVGAKNRPEVEGIFDVFESRVPESKLPDSPQELPSPPVIFIGHGGNLQWRDVKDHLHEKHGYKVEAYEIGARAGHTIRDILDDMLTKSSFAILVMTAEDKDEDGKFRARQNVIHELGLFQGRLGFSRAIVLLEEETEEFSNIHGIQQITFSKGNIKATFGDILATLRREFSK